MNKYTSLYNILKDMILKGELSAGDKVPSVRKAAELYGVSVTTVQSAYFELCADGFIISRDRSGYYVSELNIAASENKTEKSENNIRYNLTGGKADRESFDFRLWRRHIKSALKQQDRLLSYSPPKGEYDLRCAISAYIRERRNVVCSPESIIVGAGVQPLLHILCALLQKGQCVSFPDNSFLHGRGIFSDYGFDVKTRFKDADIIYVSPSHMTRWGDVMPIKRRLELLRYSEKNGSLIIEDDYENEFLYSVRPTPSLYALGKGNVVYIGSFSAMLLPGIRVSFMVLTKELLKEFEENEMRFSQTASKTEQIALCSFIRDGHLLQQTRKTRRIYSSKTKQLCTYLKELLPKAEIETGENRLQIILKADFDKDISEFEKSGVEVYVQKYENGKINLVISPSSVPSGELYDVAVLLSGILK